MITDNQRVVNLIWFSCTSRIMMLMYANEKSDKNDEQPYFMKLNIAKDFSRQKLKENCFNFPLTKLPDLDSNQDKQNQNLRYYRYTIGQWSRAVLRGEINNSNAVIKILFHSF